MQATNLKEALAVYPNPAHDRTAVNVQLPIGSLFADDLRLRLVNSEGKEVLVRRAITGANELDVRSLRVGVYFVHLTSGTTWLSGAKLTVE